jgi:glyoxylase-like metal-dependent hydrolase (beta-lactamase superfamily II)
MQTCTKITEGIYQVKLPLPFALRIVNCYLLQGDEGWTIVDTGLNTPQDQAVWQAVFDELGITPRDVNQIISTHTHPDHYGLAGWLQQFCGDGAPDSIPPVYLSPGEIEQARQTWALIGDQKKTLFHFFDACGVPDHVLTVMVSQIEEMGILISPLPRTVKAMKPGVFLDIGRYRFKAINAPGHSDGQLLLYDADEQLVLCGDQVLIRITPNISLWPFGDTDPLGSYMASIKVLAGLRVRQALPGHGPLITDWQGRLAELEEHHAIRLDKVLESVSKGATTVYEVSRHIFDYDILTAHEIRFAVTESLAHLEFLVRKGKLHRYHNGVWRYHTI